MLGQRGSGAMSCGALIRCRCAGRMRGSRCSSGVLHSMDMSRQCTRRYSAQVYPRSRCEERATRVVQQYFAEALTSHGTGTLLAEPVTTLAPPDPEPIAAYLGLTPRCGLDISGGARSGHGWRWWHGRPPRAAGRTGGARASRTARPGTAGRPDHRRHGCHGRQGPQAQQARRATHGRRLAATGAAGATGYPGHPGRPPACRATPQAPSPSPATGFTARRRPGRHAMSRSAPR